MLGGELYKFYEAALNASEVYCLNKNLVYFDGRSMGLDLGVFVLGLERMIGRRIRAIGKPHPMAYKVILRHFGAQATNSFMVADAYDPDLIGAERVGLKTVLVATDRPDQSQHCAATRIPNLGVLPELLALS